MNREAWTRRALALALTVAFTAGRKEAAPAGPPDAGALESDACESDAGPTAAWTRSAPRTSVATTRRSRSRAACRPGRARTPRPAAGPSTATR